MEILSKVLGLVSICCAMFMIYEIQGKFMKFTMRQKIVGIVTILVGFIFAGMKYQQIIGISVFTRDVNLSIRGVINSLLFIGIAILVNELFARA